MPSPSVTLRDLRIGEQGVIVQIDGSDSVAARLLEMGLLPGETVKMIGAAPMGDPIEFEVYGYRISLRQVESSRVCIEKT
ncbi:MAG: FeoA family protein [Planctomycetota bacterium]|jgi:ferrous iron transport protein A